jgi:hypothetical protein
MMFGHCPVCANAPVINLSLSAAARADKNARLVMLFPMQHCSPIWIAPQKLITSTLLESGFAD